MRRRRRALEGGHEVRRPAAGVQSQTPPRAAAEDLHFHVAGLVDESLDRHAAVAEELLAQALHAFIRLGQFFRRIAARQADAAASSLARCLRPKASICAGVGPMKTQVAVGRLAAAQRDRDVGKLHVFRVAVGIGVDGQAPDAEFFQGADGPQGMSAPERRAAFDASTSPDDAPGYLNKL